MEATEHVKQASGVATSAMVLGILSCVFNTLFFLAIVGIVLGIIAVIQGLLTRKSHPYGKAGFILGLLSFIPALAYVLSIVAVNIVDPFV